jgi:hypothetical protein
MNNCENNKMILRSLYNLSEKIIIKIETNLYNTLNKMIECGFLQNTIINLSYLTYNEIYKCMVTKTFNEIIDDFLEIQKIFSHDLLCLLKISFGVTLEIIKNINRSQYNFNSQDKFINSIENQIELITNLKSDYFFELIKNHKCNDSIDTSDPNKNYFVPK